MLTAVTRAAHQSCEQPSRQMVQVVVRGSRSSTFGVRREARSVK